MSEQSKKPWTGSLSVDLRRGALSVSADGLAIMDETRVCWALAFPDAGGNYGHVSEIVRAVNSLASNEAKIAALTKALRNLVKAVNFRDGVVTAQNPKHEDIMRAVEGIDRAMTTAEAALFSHTEQEGK